jgi:hypothetical protein
MIYYRFKKDFFDYKNNIQYANGELVTEKEFLRKKHKLNFDGLPFIEKVELSKNQVFFFFGVRVEKA